MELFGQNVWLDTKSIIGGVDFIKTIENSINDCDIYISALSSHAITSHWYSAETQRMQSVQNKQKLLVPINLDSLPPDQYLLPINIRQSINMSDFEEGFYQLMNAISQQCHLDELKSLIPDGWIPVFVEEASKNPDYLIRLACAHTLWSTLPDFAFDTLINGWWTDQSPYLKRQAKVLLQTRVTHLHHYH